MELFFIILLIIGSRVLPYIIAYYKVKKEIEEKKRAYIREIELTIKLRSGQDMTEEEFEEWSRNVHLLSEFERNDSIEDDLSRR